MMKFFDIFILKGLICFLRKKKKIIIFLIFIIEIFFKKLELNNGCI